MIKGQSDRQDKETENGVHADRAVGDNISGMTPIHTLNGLRYLMKYFWPATLLRGSNLSRSQTSLRDKNLRSSGPGRKPFDSVHDFMTQNCTVTFHNHTRKEQEIVG
jgi:hypothetical protein